MAEIKPGQWINVKVKSTPRAIAGRKTMVRLFEQDESIRRERRRHAKSRLAKPSRRGGRIWMNIPARLELAKTTPGASYRIFASIETLKALKSIEKYVEVTPA